MKKNKIIEISLISREIIEEIFDNQPDLALEIVSKAFKEKSNGGVIEPDKISQVFDESTQDRTNCLSATLLNQKVSGVKWVSVFPSNVKNNLINVTGAILLSSTETGYPLALLDGTYCTAIRTAAVGAVAADYLSRKESSTIGFIGAGEQAQMHFKMIKRIRNIKTCFVSSRNEISEFNFIKKLQNKYTDVKFVSCKGDYVKASKDADIIVTAVSCQKPLLKAKFIKKGATYIHVGGWEDEYAVVQKADKIVCDSWDSVKHRSQTLSRMYYEGLLKDSDIHGDLDQILTGSLLAREDDDEFIYFNSVGLGFIDVMFGYEIYKNSKQKKLGLKYRIQGT